MARGIVLLAASAEITLFQPGSLAAQIVQTASGAAPKIGKEMRPLAEAIQRSTHFPIVLTPAVLRGRRDAFALWNDQFEVRSLLKPFGKPRGAIRIANLGWVRLEDRRPHPRGGCVTFADRLALAIRVTKYSDNRECQAGKAPIPDLKDRVCGAKLWINVEKTRLGIPESVWSCHTAEIDGYVLEGHVPLSALERLLAERPAIRGLAVPGMPVGSPGMEVADMTAEIYEVMAFGAGDPTVYMQFNGSNPTGSR